MGRGAVATRDGEVVAYVVAEIDDERAVVGLAGCAASEPEAVRDVYAHAAREWPSRHIVYVPATDSALIEPWFQLAFGCQFKTGVRETAVEPPVEFGGTIRSSTPDDLAAVAGLEQMLWQLQAESPSFSGVDVDREDFEAAWASHWREDGYPLHAVAELDGRVVGHLVLYERPCGDLRIAERNVDISPRRNASRRARTRRRAGAHRVRIDVRARTGISFDDHRLALGEPPVVSLLAATRFQADVPTALPQRPLTRVPLLADSRLVVADAGPERRRPARTEAAGVAA